MDESSRPGALTQRALSCTMLPCCNAIRPWTGLCSVQVAGTCSCRSTSYADRQFNPFDAITNRASYSHGWDKGQSKARQLRV